LSKTDPRFWRGSNVKEKLWVWGYNDKEAYMDIGEEVRAYLPSLPRSALPHPLTL
jgi:hypothetical protein